MGSKLSCIGSGVRRKQALPVDDTYDLATDDGGFKSHATSQHQAEVDSGYSSPAIRPPTISITQNSMDNFSNNSNNSTNIASNPPNRKAPILPPTSKLTVEVKNENQASNGNSNSKLTILHDEKGYALVIPKTSKTASSSPQSSSAAHFTQNGTQNTLDSSNAPRNTIDIHNTRNNNGGPAPNKYGAKNVLILPEVKSSNETILDKDGYCNVVLQDETVYKNKQPGKPIGCSMNNVENNIYFNAADATSGPCLPPKGKPPIPRSEPQQKVQLNYIEVEIVKTPEVTSKQADVKSKDNRTLYSDVINENGHVRLVAK